MDIKKILKDVLKVLSLGFLRTIFLLYDCNKKKPKCEEKLKFLLLGKKANVGKQNFVLSWDCCHKRL